MKQRLADYLADRLVEAGICQVFTVTGGGAMHLNDALGHKDGLHCIYNHHEQASAIAAEAYARIHNRIAALCVMAGFHSHAGPLRSGAVRHHGPVVRRGHPGHGRPGV